MRIRKYVTAKTISQTNNSIFTDGYFKCTFNTDVLLEDDLS